MKKKNRRRLALFLALGMTVLLFAGCGGGGSEQASTAAPAQESAAENSQDAVAAADEVYTLTVQNHDSATSGAGKFTEEWCRQVEEASGGKLKFNIFLGGSLGPSTESYNMVTGGSADLAWCLASFTTGRFPLTDVMALPFTATDCSQASWSFWELYEGSEVLQKEWNEVKVIALHSNCDTGLLVKEPLPQSVADLAGHQCRFVGGPSTDLADLLGLIPVSVAIGDVYESLEKNVIDYAANLGLDVVYGMNLYEPVDAIWNIHLNVNPCYFVMNKKAYEGLPDDLKAIIDEYSGEKAVQIAIDAFASVQQQMYDEHGDLFYEPSEATIEEFRQYGEQVAEKWISENGQEARQLYDDYMVLLEKNQDKLLDFNK